MGWTISALSHGEWAIATIVKLSSNKGRVSTQVWNATQSTNGMNEGKVSECKASKLVLVCVCVFSMGQGLFVQPGLQSLSKLGILSGWVSHWHVVIVVIYLTNFAHFLFEKYYFYIFLVVVVSVPRWCRWWGGCRQCNPSLYYISYICTYFHIIFVYIYINIFVYFPCCCKCWLSPVGFGGGLAADNVSGTPLLQPLVVIYPMYLYIFFEYICFHLYIIFVFSLLL